MNTPLPALDMIERLRGQAGNGTFEAHVTVDAGDPGERERFREVCAELGVKCVLIELPQGVSRSQPMTSTYHRGDLDSVVREAADLARTLARRGFSVSRLKLEAVATNAGVPASDEEARAFPSGNYFEFHVKTTLPSGTDLSPLRNICLQHGAHLSSNARKREDDGRTQRFVTLRVYGVGRTRAETSFDALVEELQAAGYTLSNKLREYTIYDSNITIDAGWIDAPPGVGNAGGGGRS